MQPRKLPGRPFREAELAAAEPLQSRSQSTAKNTKIWLPSVLAAFMLVLNGCSPDSGSSSTETETTALVTGSGPAIAAMPGNLPITQNVIDVVDTNPDPGVFEAAFSVDEQDVGIDGSTVHTIIYKDVNNPGAYAGLPNGIPIPQIVVEVGDEIVVSLTNDLEDPCAAIACETSIHWHGLELDNDSDGTGVTQNSVKHGETYVPYRRDSKKLASRRASFSPGCRRVPRGDCPTGRSRS